MSSRIPPATPPANGHAGGADRLPAAGLPAIVPARPGIATLEPSLVGPRTAAAILSISLATFWRWDASGALGPRGVKKLGKRLFLLAELREWCAAGCPDRAEWDRRKSEAARSGQR